MTLYTPYHADAGLVAAIAAEIQAGVAEGLGPLPAWSTTAIVRTAMKVSSTAPTGRPDDALATTCR